MIFELPHTQYGYRSGEQVELSGSALRGAIRRESRTLNSLSTRMNVRSIVN
jgi:hypothetical protein